LFCKIVYMKFEKIHNKGQARIFRNQYLEMLTKTHPLVIWGMYVPVIFFLLYLSYAKFDFTLSYILLIFLSGMLTWTLFEYLMHRFVFHYIAHSTRAQRIVYVIHANHHEYPRDRERLFMPPVPSFIMATVVFLLQYLVFGNNAYMFFSGFLLGYLIYGTMHFAIHAWSPPFKWMKPLWRNHHLHHYKEQEKGFGVSTTIWDRVFGTMFDLKKEKEDKEKVKDLMFK
jgi:sterol desaturase/sphingolipid hydroxylase (fatty acid hydroxylase superfamily)